MSKSKGWKTIPIKPVSEMEPLPQAGMNDGLLAAAPTPPAQEDEPVYDSYLTNSVIISRAGDGPLFVGVGDKAYCRLDRYTIMPTEQYDELRRAAEEASIMIGELFGDFGDEYFQEKMRDLRAALERR